MSIDPRATPSGALTSMIWIGSSPSGPALNKLLSTSLLGPSRVDQGQPAVIDRLREMVRLAAGLDADSNLDQEAWAIGCGSLAVEGTNSQPVP